MKRVLFVLVGCGFHGVEPLQEAVLHALGFIAGHGVQCYRMDAAEDAVLDVGVVAFEAAQQRKEKPWQSWDEAFSERLAKQPFITEEERKPFTPSGAGALESLLEMMSFDCA